MKTVKTNYTCTVEGCTAPLIDPTPSTKYCIDCKPAIRKKQMMESYHKSRCGVPVTRGRNVQKKPIDNYWLVRGTPSTHGGKLFG